MPDIDEITVLCDVLLPGGRVSDITISHGIVTHLGSSGKADIKVRCSDLTVVPAGVDMHVHMRDGTQAYKEDWITGTKSALAGGVTVVIDQPNTIPAITTREIFQNRVRVASDRSYCHFGINGGVTPEADIEGLHAAGAMAFGETFAGPSSYGEAIPKEDLASLINTISRKNGLITIHAEMVREGKDLNLKAHNILRPASGEAEAVRLIHEIAPKSAKIHFCHISSEESVVAIKKSGNGTIEATPHHLFLSLENLSPDSTYAKVNPPIRTESERKNLWRYWKDIDVIGSDHAPHSKTDKSVSFDSAPSGIPGVETMIPLLMAQVAKGVIPLTDVVQKTSVAPSQILGILQSGYEPGMRADFSLYDREIEKIDSDRLSSKAGWTPFEGMDAIFPLMVLMGGEIAYDQGEFTRRSPVWLKGRGYNEGV